jgi:hypothetical protein
MLEGYIPGKNLTKRNDFVVPFIINDEIKFIGIETKKEYSYGRIVFVGVEITLDTLYKKLIDFNHNNIDLEILNKFLEDMPKYKMSDILEPDNEVIIKKSVLKMPFVKSKLP